MKNENATDGSKSNLMRAEGSLDGIKLNLANLLLEESTPEKSETAETESTSGS